MKTEYLNSKRYWCKWFHDCHPSSLFHFVKAMNAIINSSHQSLHLILCQSIWYQLLNVSWCKGVCSTNIQKQQHTFKKTLSKAFSCFHFTPDWLRQMRLRFASFASYLNQKTHRKLACEKRETGNEYSPLVRTRL